MIESNECPCCGRRDESDEIFDGGRLPCGCPCQWSVDIESAYIVRDDEEECDRRNAEAATEVKP